MKLCLFVAYLLFQLVLSFLFFGLLYSHTQNSLTLTAILRHTLKKNKPPETNINRIVKSKITYINNPIVNMKYCQYFIPYKQHLQHNKKKQQKCEHIQ